MRVLATAVFVALVVAAPACASGSAGERSDATPAPKTALRISVWSEGRDAGGTPAVRTLRCKPAGGTVRRPADACRRLLALKAPFAGVRKDMACIELYGGPEQALVTGTLRGSRVYASFSRTDGCQIERWNRVAFLFAGVA